MRTSWALLGVRGSPGRRGPRALRPPGILRRGTRVRSGIRVLRLGVAACILLAGCEDSSTGPELGLSIQDPANGDLLVGDQIQLEAVFSDPSLGGQVVWASSDTTVALVDVQGRVWAQRPGSATISADFRKASDDLVVTVVPRPGGYTAPEIDYLQEIAFGFEYGSASEVIRKWGENPRIQVFGTPTSEDWAVLQDVVADLNALMEEVEVELVDSDPTVEVHFAPVSQFSSILPSYVQGNLGYFSVWFGSDNRIYRSVVLLASDAVEQPGRSHLIREEVTQMLGLAKDSRLYPNSIFQQSWTTTQAYDPMDEALIEMLYRPQLLPGWGYRAAVDLLRTLTRRGWQGMAPMPLAPAGSPCFPPATLFPAPERGGRGGIGSGGSSGIRSGGAGRIGSAGG